MWTSTIMPAPARPARHLQAQGHRAATHGLSHPHVARDREEGHGLGRLDAERPLEGRDHRLAGLASGDREVLVGDEDREPVVDRRPTATTALRPRTQVHPQPVTVAAISSPTPDSSPSPWQAWTSPT